MTKKDENFQLLVSEVKMLEVRFNVLGVSPFIMHRFSQKAWQQLLLPQERQSRATLEQKLKHDPLQEFRGATYRNRDDKTPTLFHLPNGMFHGALAQVAVDVPGAARAKIERLTKCIDVNINFYGTPQLFMSMVRNSDMSRTPDVRTRPIFPEWACTVTFQYMAKVLTETTVANLFGAAGQIVGIGDWRGERGGPFGRFCMVNDNNPAFKRIVSTQGRAAQEAAFEKPAYYDLDTEELMLWFETEVARRELAPDVHIYELEGSKGDETLIEPEVAETKSRRKNGPAATK